MLNKNKGEKLMNRNIIRLILVSSATISITMGGSNIVPVDIPVVPVPVEKGPFYVGVGASYMSLLNNNTDEEFTATGITLQAGYRYNDYIAIEGRYTRDVSAVAYENGTSVTFADNDDYPTDFTNMAIYLKPIYPIGDFGIYALLGYGEVALTNIPVGSVTRGESGFQWGVGMSYDIYDSFTLFADYTSLYSGDGFDYLATLNSHDATLITVGLSYRF